MAILGGVEWEKWRLVGVARVIVRGVAWVIVRGVAIVGISLRYPYHFIQFLWTVGNKLE